MTLKSARVLKKLLLLLTPIVQGILLAPRLTHLSLGAFGLKGAVGFLYGANQFLYRRKFEDPLDSYHVKAIKLEQSSDELPLTTCQKVKSLAIRYMPSMAFLGLLTGYMSWVATTNRLTADIGIIILLAGVWISFISTTLLANFCPPTRNRCLTNELYFRLIFFNLGLSLCFQYITSKIEITDVQLDKDPPPIYAMALVGWLFWSLVVGSNRATYMQETRPAFSQTTPPIAMQELGKLFYRTFFE